MNVDATEMIKRMGIKKKWLADRMAIPESTLRNYLKQDTLSDMHSEMIIQIISHAYHNYFLPYKNKYESPNSKH